MEKTTSNGVKYKIKLDKNKCIGCGSCAAVCPEVFRMGEGGKSEMIQEEIEKLGCAKTAEESCPTKAIEIIPIKESKN